MNLGVKEYMLPELAISFDNLCSEIPRKLLSKEFEIWELLF